MNLVDAFEADPVLTDFGASAADAAPSEAVADEVTADEAAAIDAETAADAGVEVGGIDVLIDLFIFI